MPDGERKFHNTQVVEVTMRPHFLPCPFSLPHPWNLSPPACITPPDTKSHFTEVAKGV